jgi:peptidylprolyl isomerase
MAVSISAAAIVVAILAALIGSGFRSNSKSETTTSTSSASTSSTPTTAAVASAKGKPCVAVKGPLPTGAPKVPLQTGPPPTKLVTKDLSPGTGAVVTATQTLSVDYIGVACSTGKIFDASYADGKPREFSLGQVIPGWTQGIAGMKVGGSRLLGVPPDLGYGAQGRPPDIAPDETLWFVVHVQGAK